MKTQRAETSGRRSSTRNRPVAKNQRHPFNTHLLSFPTVVGKQSDPRVACCDTGLLLAGFAWASTSICSSISQSRHNGGQTNSTGGKIEERKNLAERRTLWTSETAFVALPCPPGKGGWGVQAGGKGGLVGALGVAIHYPRSGSPLSTPAAISIGNPARR